MAAALYNGADRRCRSLATAAGDTRTQRCLLATSASRSLLLALLFLLGGSSAGHAAPAAAPQRGDTLTEALHFLGRINTASAMQPAACHGSLGVDVGAGLSNYTLPPGNAALESQLGLNNQSSSSYSMPRLWLTKGLPLPIDLGLSAGVPGAGNGRGITQLSAYLQWTVYQALARPAVAVRAEYGRLYGVTGTSLSSTGGEVIASYGFWRYITLFGRGGFTQNQGTLVIGNQSPLGFMLRSDEPTLRTSSSWVQFERAIGMRLTLWSPLLAISGEADYSYAAQPGYTVKLSYLL